MVWPIIVRTLAAAGAATWRAAQNPAVRRAALQAAKKAESAFSRFAKRATQQCGKAWRAIRGRNINISPTALQKKFKHAKDFGVDGNYSSAHAVKFQQKILNHVSDATTKVIEGTYRGDPVRHYLDPRTGLNVVKDVEGNFVTGWKLSPAQLNHVLTTGALGGG